MMEYFFNHKIMFLCFIAFCLSAAYLCSCESMPVNYSRTKSWQQGKKKVWATFSLLGVTVDRAGGRDSVEKEITALAPLCFWEEGCQIVSWQSRADYAADIQLREREYSSGWRTKRSLLVIVRIWPYTEEAGEKQDYSRTLPLAAGRVITTGELSLSSFETTNRMLSKAIHKAVRQLAAQKKRQRQI